MFFISTRARVGVEVQASEILPAMERQKVRIVFVMRASLCIIKCRPNHGDDIFAVKLPIGILKSMFQVVRMIEQNAAEGPVLEVF